MKNVFLDVGGECNNNCWFCPSDKTKFKSFEEIKEEADKLSDKSSLIVLKGGEPTIHQDFLEIISYLNEKFAEVSFVTNGRSFFYLDFCKEIINRHVDRVFVKVEGHTKQVHDPLTTIDDSFDQTVQGIKNLVSLGVEVNSYIFVTEQNFIFLPRMVDFLKGLPVNEIHLTMPKPIGNSLKFFDKLTPRYVEIKKSILDVFEKDKTKIFIEDVPLCFLKESTDSIIQTTNKSKIKLKACKECLKKEKCPGIWKNYVDMYGDSEIKPFLDHPTEVAIEVTSKCNLDCNFCFNKNYYDKNNPIHPNLEEIKKIIDKIPVDFVSQLRITGGEPLVRDDIFEILSYAKSRGFSVWLNTNGTLVTKENAKKIAKYVDNVLLPLDSYDEESEFKLTGKGLLKEKMDSIKLLKEAGVKVVRAGTVATKDAIENFEKFYSIVLKSDLDDWELYRQVPTKENKNPLTNEDIKVLADKLLALNESFGKEFYIVNALPFCSYDMEKMSKVVKGNESDDGHIRFVIGADGNARPSYYLNYKIGNINENTIEEIWNNKFMKDMRSLRLVPDMCVGCDYLKKCKGGSRFVAELVGGSYGSEDPLSRVDKTTTFNPGDGGKSKRASDLVVLFNPSTYINSREEPKPSSHRGLLCLASVLTKKNLTVKLIEQKWEKDWKSKLIKYLKMNPVCVGISSMTGTQIYNALEASKLVKQYDSTIPVVWGGYHPTLLPDQTLENKYIDILVRGEGEISFYELVKALKQKRELSDIRGISFKKAGNIIHNKEMEFVELDKVPLLDYGPLLEEYPGREKEMERILPLTTSRGCPGGCGFCSVSSFYKGTWRALTPEQIIGQIKYFMQKSPFKKFKKLVFSEDNFFVDLNRVKKFVELVKQEKLDFMWGADCRIDTLHKIDEGFLKNMYDSGLRSLLIGLESGSNRILRLLNKNITKEMILEVNKKLAKFNIEPHYSFIVGFPTETMEEMKQTVALAKRLKSENKKAKFLKLNKYVPYPRTNLYDLAVKEGFTPPTSLIGWSDLTFYKDTPVNLPYCDIIVR